MNWVRKEIKAASDRFRVWIYPMALRPYKHVGPRGGSRLTRYPSPGNEPVSEGETQLNYKTAYRDSPHHIRYNVDIHPMMESGAFLADPLGNTATEKLIRLGYLAKDQGNDKGAIEKARKLYEEKTGESVDIKVYRDDLEYAPSMEDKDSREFVNELVSNAFEATKQLNYQEGWFNNLDEVYHPTFYYLQSFDMQADDPVYRQLSLDLEFQLDEIAERRTSMGKFPIFKAKKATWNILDDSFSNENIQKVQSSVGVYEKDNHQETAPALQEGVVPKQKEEVYVTVPHRTQFVE